MIFAYVAKYQRLCFKKKMNSAVYLFSQIFICSYKSLFASFFAFTLGSFLFQWIPSLCFQFKLLTIASDQCTT